MKQLLLCATAAGLLLTSQTSSAWGAFSRWTTAARPQSDSICRAIRSTLSTRTGLAFMFFIDVGGEWETHAFAENVTGRNKGADVWLQAWHARSMFIAGESQVFNVPTGQHVSMVLTSAIPTYAVRCAVQ